VKLDVSNYLTSNSQTQLKNSLLFFYCLKNFFNLGCSVKRGSPFLAVNGKYLLFIAIIMDNYIQLLKSQFRLFPFAFLADCAPIGAWFLCVYVSTARCAVLLIFSLSNFDYRSFFHCFSFRPFVPSPFRPISLYLVPCPLYPSSFFLVHFFSLIYKIFSEKCYLCRY
jgi:hypothetical protein